MTVDTQTERVNIKKLTVESPEKGQGPWFDYDIERATGDVDWEAIYEKAKKTHETESAFLRDLKWFSPKAFDSLLATERRWEDLDLADRRTMDNWKILARLNFVSPGYIEKHNFTTRHPQWAIARLGIDVEDDKRYFKTFDLICLYPEALPLLKGTQKESEKMLLSIRKNMRRRQPANDFALHAAIARVLFPQRQDAFGFSAGDWQRTLRYFEYQLDPKNNVTHLIPEFARDLKILAARDVQVTARGLEISMPNRDLEPAAAPLPESRKF